MFVKRGGVAVAAAVALLVSQLSMAAALTIEVDAGGADRVETPVSVAVASDLTPGTAVEIEGPSGKTLGQIVGGPETGKMSLWWLVSLKKGQKATYRADLTKAVKPAKVFAFEDTKGEHFDLLYDGRKVTRLVYIFNPEKHFPPLRTVKDDAGKKVPHPEDYNAADRTSRLPSPKPFTHVFDTKGEKVITSPGGDPYPHHRGIFLGYKVGVAGKRYDFWHCRNVWQRLERVEGKAIGPALGRMAAVIKWESKKDTPIVTEERVITVYRQSKGEVLLDFVSTLRSEAGDLDLGGDPEHAGFQFRPHFDVAKRGKETKYVHPPGMKPGNKGTKDMPWSTLSYALGDSRFNVAHLNHPDNPKGTIYSAYRDYGRFGAFGKAPLPADKPLTLRYRIYVREGKDAALTAEEAQRLYADFATPPAVTVK